MIDLTLNARWPARLLNMPWAIIALIVAIGGFGAVVLYSAAAGSFDPWASRHLLRFALLLLWMLALAQVPLRFWLSIAWPLYALVLLSLIGVEILGAVAGGSQRWLDLGFVRLQPSELMKICVVIALARFYHYMPRGAAGTLPGIWPPVALTMVPAALVLLQPDLGTTLTIIAGGVAMMFLGGLPWRFLLIPGAIGLASLPFLYNLLHPYQQRRVLIFLNPEDDPLGAGYHITQSKIAIGSGGLTGKGFMQGSQSHLDYLPEPQTDFVFATMAEEWGLLGGALLILAFLLVLHWSLRVAIATQTSFGRMLAAGLSMTIFFYVLINLMMVMGLAPVVGIPLPLMSYGGSSMLTVMTAMGIIISVWRQRTDRMI